jgi:hypothetical protein
MYTSKSIFALNWGGRPDAAPEEVSEPRLPVLTPWIGRPVVGSITNPPAPVPSIGWVPPGPNCERRWRSFRRWSAVRPMPAVSQRVLAFLKSP